MPFQDLFFDLGLMPLRAIAFQSVLLMVAIGLEAILLRQRLRLGYQTSIQYAATLNLLATSLGWVAFLTLEALLPPPLRSQIISFVMFNRFYPNEWLNRLPVLTVVAAMVVFFATYWVKLQGLTWLMLILGRAPAITAAPTPEAKNRRQRYEQARRGKAVDSQRGHPSRTLAVLEANALSFSAILILLLLHHGTRGL